MGTVRPKTQSLRLCNLRTKRYDLANCSYCAICHRIGNGNLRKFPAIYHGTIVALTQTTYKQETVGTVRPKTQSLRLCNLRTKRYDLANCSYCAISKRIGNANSRKFPAIYHGTIVALMQTTYEQDAVGIGRPKTQTLRLCNQRTKR